MLQESQAKKYREYRFKEKPIKKSLKQKIQNIFVLFISLIFMVVFCNLLVNAYDKEYNINKAQIEDFIDHAEREQFMNDLQNRN